MSRTVKPFWALANQGSIQGFGLLAKAHTWTTHCRHGKLHDLLIVVLIVFPRNASQRSCCESGHLSFARRWSLWQNWQLGARAVYPSWFQGPCFILKCLLSTPQCLACPSVFDWWVSADLDRLLHSNLGNCFCLPMLLDKLFWMLWVKENP